LDITDSFESFVDAMVQFVEFVVVLFLELLKRQFQSVDLFLLGVRFQWVFQRFPRGSWLRFVDHQQLVLELVAE
jgi:hypothetical protein